MVIYWLDFSQSEPITTSSVLSESVWNNSFIKINFKSIKPSFFGISQHLFVKDLLDDNGIFLSWDNIRFRYNIHQKHYFKWMQLKSSIPKKWLKLTKTDLSLQHSLCNFEPHINIKSRICSVEKLTSSAIYQLYIKRIEKPSTSQSFFNDKFDVSNLWKKIYLLPRYATVDSYSRIFQYKILNNILFLNDKLFHLKFVPSPLCSLCGNANENVKHLFFECLITKSLWNSLQHHLQNYISLPDLTLQSAVFGFLDDSIEVTNATNHILLIFKIFLFKNRTFKPTPTLLFAIINNIINIEGQLCFTSRQRNKHSQKWGKMLKLV